MKFFGKPIPTDKINFVMNCISFILGLIFFIRMQYKLNEPPVPVSFNAEHDSLIKIEYRVNTQLNQLKHLQDSIVREINHKQVLLSQGEKEIVVKRRQLYSTIKSDWDNLDNNDQNAYVNKLMSNLKQKK
jgi:hypothetical protein